MDSPPDPALRSSDAPAPGEDLASWLRRRQREQEAALDAEGRIRLALRLGLRAHALGQLLRPERTRGRDPNDGSPP